MHVDVISKELHVILSFRIDTVSVQKTVSGGFKYFNLVFKRWCIRRCKTSRPTLKFGEAKLQSQVFLSVHDLLCLRRTIFVL